MKKIISAATSAVMVFSLVGQPSYTMASGLQKVMVENVAADSTNITPTVAKVSKFSLYGTDKLASYDAIFKLDKKHITNISSNTGSNGTSVITNAVDGDINTFWEAKQKNTDTVNSAVEFKLDEATELDRIVYIVRQDGASKGKGFPQEFEVYASTTDEGDDFSLVTTGSYTGSTTDVIEIQFAPTTFKRIKFVYKKVNRDWASAAEFSFYKPDEVASKMANLFTDAKQNQVSAEFNSPEKIEALEKLVKAHPFYDQYKEDLENAKILVNNTEKIVATKATTKSISYYSNEKYSELFRLSSDNIKSFKNNGGYYGSQVLKYAFDGDATTYWETRTGNTSTFSNEVEVEFNDTVTLNRIVYGARKDLKGFAQEFEIYGTKTSKGDTYELVATGAYNKTSGLVEAEFEPTEFKRLKFVFKKSDQNWATLTELAFYKVDEIDNIMDGLFTDGTKSAVVSEYNSIEQLNALEEKVQEHPLYSIYKEDLELAKKLVNNEVDMTDKIITAEQRGDMRKHAQQKLKMNFGTNNQATGLVAQPGDTITVYVDADSSTAKLPSLYFTQHEGYWNYWASSVALHPGKNTIVVPDNSRGGNFVKGGTIYINNPYTAEEQGKAPVLRFEGVEKVPMMTLDTDPEKFKEELIAYKKKIDEDVAAHPNVADREVVDVVEMVSNHVIYTGTATAAYNQFIKNSINPMDVVTGYDVWMNQIFKTYGLDGSSEVNDPKLIRENIRIMQSANGSFMYAAGEHVGILKGSAAVMLADFSKSYPGWGVNHEIGHRLAISAREYGEVTNNMVSMLMSEAAGSLDNRIPFETMYKYLIGENKISWGNQGQAAQLGAHWQLELAHPGYWAELSKMYRERNISVSSDSQKQQYYVELSSEILGYDLSSYFARHGFTVTEETKAKTAKYPEPKKLWYLNNSVRSYEGTGFADKNASIAYSVKVDSSAKKNTLNFRIDDAYSKDVLGYEIYRDGELIGFTSTNQFVDSTDVTVNHTYKIVAYDKKLNTANPVEFKAFVPSMSVEDQVTLKLNQAFDAKNYVKAVDYQGNDISGEVTVKSNVDVTKKGNYEIVYEVQNEGSTVTKTTHVTVTSDFDYVSDLTPESAKVGWSQLKKDTDIGGGTIDLFRQGLPATYAKGLGAHANSELVYDIEDKGYDYFESYIGIDYDATRTKASATFEVYVDGEKKFSSDVIKVSTEHGYVKVPVTGAKQIKLVTTDAGDGNASDHTLWADAKFTINSSAPSLTIPTSDAGIEMVKLNEDFDFKAGVTASDVEDGNLTDEVKVETNGFTTKKTGTYTVKYTVTDNDGNTVSKERKIVVYSATNYTSDMQWQSATAGWKTVQKDKNIEGNTLQLLVNGQVKNFAKGIGTHADSEIVYDLSGTNAEYFETYVGVDRNFSWNTGAASVIFKIMADGEEVYNSGLMKYGTEAKHVVIPVKGVKELKLVVNDSGNGTDSDRADFADAKFYILDNKPELEIPTSETGVEMVKLNEEFNLNADVTATDAEDGNLTDQVKVETNGFTTKKPGTYTVKYTITDNDGNTVSKERKIFVYSATNYASDMQWESATAGWKTVQKDKNIEGNTLQLLVNGQVKNFAKGIGTHADSEIVYDLSGTNAEYFETYVGVDRNFSWNTGAASVIFKIMADGEEVYNSGLMKYGTEAKHVVIPVKGVKELKLVVNNSGNGTDSDRADFADAKFYTVDIYTADLEQAIEEAKSISLDEYTEESANVFTAKLAAAEELLTKENVTQSEVDAALEALKSAIEGLIKIDLTQAVTVKDSALRDAIKETLGVTGDLTLGDMYKLTELTYHGARQVIQSLEGLEYAKNLVTLDITGNEVTDFSPLKDLKKLTNLKANPQYKVVGMLTGSSISLENLVTDIDGNKVLPNGASLRNNKTSEETVIDTNEWSENLDMFNIDMTNQESGMYTLTLGYEVNGNLIQLVYMVKHSVDLTQVVDVKDSTLRDAIKETLGVTGDLTLGDMYKLTELTYHGARQVIQSLEGLEYAKNLVTLDITGNEVTDFSPLKDLKKLTNLKANPQYKVVGMLTGSSNINVENLVTDVDGNKVLPNVASLRNNTTSEETVIDTNEWSENLDMFTIDMTNQESGMYTLSLGFEVNGNLIQLIYMINNK